MIKEKEVDPEREERIKRYEKEYAHVTGQARQFSEKACNRCGSMFKPVAANQKYCQNKTVTCATVIAKQKEKLRRQLA